jgi:arsenate reductase
MRILFICVGNSCRSQMAEGIANSLGYKAESAGTHPAKAVSNHAITVLQNRGIDTTKLRPKSLDDFNVDEFDKVISMGCGVHCPMIKIDQDWELDDPVGQEFEIFEQTANEIEKRIRLLD